MSINREEWRWVPGYENLYMVSDLGNVMATEPRRGSQVFKPMRQSMTGSGYPKVVLRKRGKSTNAMVHRLVAAAFLPNPEHKDEVNHIDGNKKNNRLANLEWVTRSENALHASRVLGKHGGGVEHSVKITPDIAREIFTADGSFASIGRKYGISDVMVSRIKHRKAWREATCQLTNA